jgi:predicted RNase H-like HicB family nuclease
MVHEISSKGSAWYSFMRSDRLSDGEGWELFVEKRDTAHGSIGVMPNSLANVLDQPNVHILISEEDGTYIAKCLDIPGCISEGATRDEALANVHNAIRLCLSVLGEDQAKPTPDVPQIEIIEARTSDFLEKH